jgi:uncharacterized protein (TIGR02757 family)
LKNYHYIRRSLDRLHDVHQHDIASDPIQFPLRFKNSKDREVVAFFSAMYAFGNVKMIFNTLENICGYLGSKPYEKVRNMPDRNTYKFSTHRWIKPTDTHSILQLLQALLNQHGTLEKSFMQFYNPDQETVEESLSKWLNYLKMRLTEIQGSSLTRGQKFLLASPDGGSTTKRAVMFLRWMVRTQRPDLGLWKKVSPSKLMMPLDAHLFRFSQYLGFTQQKQHGWKAVKEATGHFRKICPEDPVKYDFALARLGILDLCVHEAGPKCASCLLQTHCNLYKSL